MKKLTFGVFLLSMFLVFYACNKTETVLDEKVSLEKVLEDYNSDKDAVEKGEIISGKVLIQDINDATYIAVIKDENAPVHTSFFFQPGEGFDLLEEEMNNGTALFLKDHILLRNNDTQAQYLISLSDGKTTPHLSGFIADENLTAIGIGSTEVKLRQEEDVYRGIKIKIVEVGHCTCIKNNAPKNCQAGGLGATSCTCCGCSVTCGAGYFACCDP